MTEKLKLTCPGFDEALTVDELSTCLASTLKLPPMKIMIDVHRHKSAIVEYDDNVGAQKLLNIGRFSLGEYVVQCHRRRLSEYNTNICVIPLDLCRIGGEQPNC